jgi:3-hydroxyacyl-[acyl-carrier-protein] dehydratase
MLDAGFYTVLEQHNNDNTIQAKVELNPTHEIFKGHFPNNPVTPGVCMLQIFKDLVEHQVEQTLMISECSNVKFMAIINPEIHPLLDLSISYTLVDDAFYKIKATAVFDTTTAIKLNIVLKIVA